MSLQRTSQVSLEKTYCFRKSRPRALLFGSRPEGGFPIVPTVAAFGFAPPQPVALIHVCVRLGGPPEAAPLGTEPTDSKESEHRGTALDIRVERGRTKRRTRTLTLR